MVLWEGLGGLGRDLHPECVLGSPIRAMPLSTHLSGCVVPLARERVSACHTRQPCSQRIHFIDRAAGVGHVEQGDIEPGLGAGKSLIIIRAAGFGRGGLGPIWYG
jgi:hypothetical protein